MLRRRPPPVMHISTTTLCDALQKQLQAASPLHLMAARRHQFDDYNEAYSVGIAADARVDETVRIARRGFALTLCRHAKCAVSACGFASSAAAAGEMWSRTRPRFLPPPLCRRERAEAGIGTRVQ